MLSNNTTRFLFWKIILVIFQFSTELKPIGVIYFMFMIDLYCGIECNQIFLAY